MTAPQEIIIKVVVEQPSTATAPVSDGFEEVKGNKYTPSQKLRLALMYRHKRLLADATKAWKINPDFEEYYKTAIAYFVSEVESREK